MSTAYEAVMELSGIPVTVCWDDREGRIDVKEKRKRELSKEID